MDELARRVEALETRIAHQDATIEDLDATITAQWRIVDGLKRDMAALLDRMHDLGRRDAAPEAPPPHY